MNVAWASGLFAGEGCAGIAVSKIKSGDYRYMLLQIGMYDERSIARFAETFGVNYGFVFLANRNRNFYRCHVRGRTAEKVFAKIGEMAAAGDYQFWVERVDASGLVGVVLEDGEVKADLQGEAQ